MNLAGVEDEGILTLGAITGGHASFVGAHYAMTRTFMPFMTQGAMLAKGIPSAVLAHSLYNSALDLADVPQDAFSRSFLPQIGVAIGGGMVFAQGGPAAWALGTVAVVNEATPYLVSTIHSPEVYESRASALALGRQEMARAWAYDEDLGALATLSLASIPIFDDLATWAPIDEATPYVISKLQSEDNFTERKRTHKKARQEMARAAQEDNDHFARAVHFISGLPIVDDLLTLAPVESETPYVISRLQSEDNFTERKSTLEKAKQQMAQDWVEKRDPVALFTLAATSIPVLDDFATLLVD